MTVLLKSISLLACFALIILGACLKTPWLVLAAAFAFSILAVLFSLKNQTPPLRLLLAAGLLLFCGRAPAQQYQFAQSTWLTIPTNSTVLVATPFSIYVPPISLTITATNPGTLVTNNIINCLNIGGSNYIISSTFIYSAATMGTNFTTNWAGYYIPCTNYTFGQAIPQTGTNPVSIK